MKNNNREIGGLIVLASPRQIEVIEKILAGLFTSPLLREVGENSPKAVLIDPHHVVDGLKLAAKSLRNKE